jgi:hypothetical protein
MQWSSALRTGHPRCAHCGDVLAGRHFIVDARNICRSCHKDSIPCSFCGVPTPRSGLAPARLGPDGQWWCSSCGKSLVGIDVDAYTALSSTRGRLKTLGVRIGISELAVELVPVTRKDQGLSDSVLGLAHSSFDGHEWNHRVKIRRFVPEFLFGAVLVHELIHVWIARSELNLPPTHEQEEGICELFAKIWLESDPNAVSARRWTRNAETRTDAYGRGYRWAAAQFGSNPPQRLQRAVASHFGGQARRQPE